MPVFVAGPEGSTQLDAEIGELIQVQVRAFARILGETLGEKLKETPTWAEKAVIMYTIQEELNGILGTFLMPQPMVRRSGDIDDVIDPGAKRGSAKGSSIGYIYRITHKATGRTYVGSTNRILRVRWKEHLKRLRNNNHLNPELQAVYNREGAKAFEFRFIQKVPPDQVETREQYWRDLYAKKPAGVYNTGEDTKTPFKGRTHSEATKQRIRNSVKSTLREKKKAVHR